MQRATLAYWTGSFLFPNAQTFAETSLPLINFFRRRGKLIELNVGAEGEEKDDEEEKEKPEDEMEEDDEDAEEITHEEKEERKFQVFFFLLLYFWKR